MMWALGTRGNSPHLAAPHFFFRVVNACVCIAVVLTSSLLANTTSELSDKYPTFITPAGWTFSIWGLIFFLQISSVIYTSLPFHYLTNDDKLIAVSATGGLWILGWLFEILWSSLFVIDHLAALVSCAVMLVGATSSFYFSLLCLREHPELYSFKTWRHWLLYTLYILPTSINTAWLSVAASLAILVIPSYSNASTAVAVSLAICFACVLTVVGIANVLFHRDLPYGATLIWSFSGVVAKQSDRSIFVSVLVCLCLLGIAMLYVLLMLGHDFVESRRSRGPRLEMDIDTDTDDEYDKLEGGAGGEHTGLVKP